MQSEHYPFTAIVGQEAMRTALVVCAVDPSLGGVLVRGHKGTGKSTAARSLARLLPPIEVVEGCPFHCDPDAPAALHDGCRERAAQGEPLPRTVRPAPMVELPLGATEDRLVGTLHVEHALRTGERRFEPGLLAAAHRGILYIDEVNLLDDHLVDLLLDVSASGVNIVEREGVSCSHAAELLLVGTMNPEEGELRPQLLDRFGLCVTVTGLAPPSSRHQVLRRRLAFESDPRAFGAVWAKAERGLAARILGARRRLHGVALPDEVLAGAVRIAAASDARGHRADLAIVKTARALAALLDAATVEPSHLAEAAFYALPHRLHAPLATPETAAARITEILAGLGQSTESAGRQPEGPPGGEEGDDDDWAAMAESIQVPGAAAAGSILFTLEKKSPPNESSTPTS